MATVFTGATRSLSNIINLQQQIGGSCGCGLLPPSLWCGVVRVWALVVPPLHPLWRGMGWVVPPACLDLLGVFGKPMLLDRGGTIFVTVVALEQSE